MIDIMDDKTFGYFMISFMVLALLTMWFFVVNVEYMKYIVPAMMTIAFTMFILFLYFFLIAKKE